MFDLRAILGILLSASAIAAAVVWLAREAMRLLFNRSLESYKAQIATSLEIHKSELAASLESHRSALAASLESHKAQLAAESARQLANLSSELERVTFRYTTTFSVMHQRRADIVSKLYRLFVDAEDRADFYLSNRQAEREEELATYAYDALRPLMRYLRRHRIYLTDSLCDRAFDLLSTIHSPVWMATMLPQEAAKDGKEVVTTAERIEQFTFFRKGVAKLRPELEKEFRQVIGSDQETVPSNA